MGIGYIGLVRILIIAKRSLNTWGKGFQVTVDRRVALGMGDIDRIAKAIDALCDTTDIAITNRIDQLTLNIIGGDVKTTVEMIRTGLTKIPRQRNVIIHWRGKYT